MSSAQGAFRVAGVPIDAMALDDAADWVLERTATGKGGAVHHANAYTLSLAARDPAYRETLQSMDLVVPDGMPLVWIGRRLGFDLPERAYGPDILARVADLGRAQGVRHHLFGATPEVTAKAATTMRQRWPGVEIVAADAPPFGPVTDEFVAEATARMCDVGADVVWVALGTPRQDPLTVACRPNVPGVLLGVGAAFDYLAGSKPQAPPALQRAGLEWAFRLATEPRRLMGRYLGGNLVFLASVARDRPRRLDQPDASSR